jgi:hypothetical protein
MFVHYKASNDGFPSFTAHLFSLPAHLSQHPDGCVVSVHPECTGMAFPMGDYICMNHGSRKMKTRIRRRNSARAALDSEETEDEATEVGEEEGGGGGGSDAAKADVDSEATVSERTQSQDSATEDEGTSKRQRK